MNRLAKMCALMLAAGLVFAFTMIGMAVSNLIIIGQVGTTIGLGLLFDTLVVRSLMTPSLAALLGRWFWWPLQVRKRPKPAPWPQPRQVAAAVPPGTGAAVPPGAATE